MKRTQLILWTGGLLLISCTKNKVDLPATPPPAAVSTPAPTGDAQAAPATMPAQPAAAPAATATVPAATTAAAPSVESNVGMRLSGEVASQTKSQLSFRVGGFIQDLKVKTGVNCKKGDVLAVLDTRDYKLSLDMARSQKEMAQVALTNAKSEFEREEELKKANVSTESMFDKLKAGYDKARLDLQMADLKLTQAQQALQDTKLVAPYNCVVSKQLRNMGERVNPGDAVFELYDTTDVELNFQVPERLAGKIKIGDKLKVSIPATGFAGDLEVVRLVPIVEQASRTFRVIAKAPEHDERVVPGLYAEAQLH
ncbi:efflux RND transporter periplasmic adaptor subunit [Oligoflexus tunisiensis]|uniref:efflux RND transporter periplasmic adaptor subunit n=1 Tax=Oligoflexus tunisiensis TaxID=708132 RepID=UPI00114C99A4|nr:efflux RND transporter periplasmic adaptor subunit [Oligoflexus tunisiensis]